MSFTPGKVYSFLDDTEHLFSLKFEKKMIHYRTNGTIKSSYYYFTMNEMNQNEYPFEEKDNKEYLVKDNQYETNNQKPILMSFASSTNSTIHSTYVFICLGVYEEEEENESPPSSPVSSPLPPPTLNDFFEKPLIYTAKGHTVSFRRGLDPTRTVEKQKRKI